MLHGQTSSEYSLAPNSWIHIPTPGDHYSPSTGSAIMTVISELTRHHEQTGSRDLVLVSEGTYSDYYEPGTPVTVPASKPVSRAMKAIDVICSRTGLPRLFSGRPYLPFTSRLPRDFDGVVFVYNEPQALPVIRKAVPKADVWLYAQNDLFRTYRRSEVERVMRHATGMICVSEYIRRLAIDKAPAIADRLHTVLNGVNTAHFYPPSERPSRAIPEVLFVGRVVHEKGPHVLIQAAKRLAEREVPFSVRIVGSSGFTDRAPLSDYEQSLRDLAEPLGDRIVFTPFVDRKRVVKLFQDADVMCVPSVWEEPFGLIVAEAMACGLPVAAARRGGIPEAGGDAAVYFDPTSPTELADCLEPLLRDAKLRNSSGQVSRARAEELAWKNIYFKLESIVRR